MRSHTISNADEALLTVFSKKIDRRGLAGGTYAAGCVAKRMTRGSPASKRRLAKLPMLENMPLMR